MSVKAKKDQRSAMVLTGLFDEIERQVNAAQNIEELRASIDKAVLEQTKAYALALFDDSRGMSEFETQLHMLVRGKIEACLRETLGTDHWGKAAPGGMVGQAISKIVGEIAGGYVANMLASSDFADNIRANIAEHIPEAVRYSFNYDTKREIERVAKEILTHNLFSSDERK